MNERRGRATNKLIVALLFLASIVAPLRIVAHDPGVSPTHTGSPAPSAIQSPGPAESPVPSESPAPDPGPVDEVPTPGPQSPGPAPPTAAPTPEPAPPTPTPADPPAGESPSPEPSPSPSPTTVANVPYVLTFSTQAAFAERSALLAGAGLIETAAIEQLRIAIVDVPADGAGELIATLRSNPAVARLEPDRERTAESTPDDPLYADQWALPAIGWEQVRLDPPGNDAVVAVLDTGVDGSHPDLAGALVSGVSYVADTPPDSDPNGHGTWMAGIVAAAADNAAGIAGAGNGVLRVMPVTVLGADGSGRDSDIIAGLVYAVDSGADVILMAFSSHGYSVALQAAADYAWEHDVVLVAAAGNDGTSQRSYPAGDRSVIGVAATQADGSVWPASTSGPSVFLAAPGARVLTTTLDDTYDSISGTSAAAAYVAAAAGLLRAQDTGLSNGAIVGRLARTAAPVGTTETTGNGLLDLGRAWTDSSTDPVRPAGAHDADGGPFVGPYEDADGNPVDEPPTYSAAASPSFRAAAQNGVTTGATSLAISKPTGTTTGDIMVAAISVRPSTATISAPLGWTLIRRTDVVTGATSSQAMYYKIASASEGASYTWTLGAGPTGAAGGIATFYDASSCAPIDVSAGQATVSALTHAAPSVTTTQSGDMLITGHSFASAATWTPPAGMTEMVDRASDAVPAAGGISLEMNYLLLGAAGATGAQTATASNDADSGVGISVAIRSTCTKTWDGGAATSNWGDANNWNPNGVPTASDDVSLTGANTINVNVAASTHDLTLNNASLVLTVNSGQSLTVTGNLTATTGTLANAGTVTATGASAFNAGSLYQHNQNGGTIPTATWATTSTMSVIGWTSQTTAPGGIDQAFGNFTWDSPSQTAANVSLALSPTTGLATVNGDLVIASTGTGSIAIGNSATFNVTVGGNFSQTGGTLRGSITAARTITVAGDFSLTGGTLDLSSSATSTNPVTVNVAGNFTATAGTLTETGATTGSGIVFNGSGTQTYTSGATVSNTVSFTVNSGATLQMAADTTTVVGGGAFTLSSGGTLGITSSAGITSSGATGNVQVTGTRTFSTGASYIYNGSAAQATGNGMPATVNNLTIANTGPATVTLGATRTIAGNLTVSAGTLDLATFTANRSSAGGTMMVSNGATLKIGGASRTLPSNYSTHSIGATSTVEYAGTTTSVAALNSSQSYGNLVISGSATTTSASFAVVGTLTVSGTFTPASTSVISGAGTLTGAGTTTVTRTAATADFASQYTIANKTLTNLTVEYAGAAAQTVTALTYGGLRVNNANGVMLAGGATATSLTLLAGNVTTGASTLAVASGGSVSRTSGHVVGNLQRAVPTGSPSVTFDIGDATNYTPVTIAFASVSTGGTLIATTAAGDHAQLASSAIVPSKSVNRAWTLSGTGIVFTTYSATATFVVGDIDAGASTSSFIMARYATGSWTTAGTGTRTSTSTQGTGIAGFGELAVGMPDLGIFTANADIGGPSLAGSASHSSGTYTLTGSGADIWGTSDQFHFVYLPESGDVRITARVVSMTNTDPWAKAGVMIRGTTAAGSMHAMSVMSPSNGMSFQWRASTGGTSLESTQAGLSAPYWVRLTRTGNSFVAERSSDGVSWTQQGTAQTIAMSASTSVGLAITSHDNASLGTAVFDNVTVTSAPSATADTYTAQASATLNVSAAEGVLDNDTDPENDPLTASLVSATGNGSLTLNPDGSFSYSPTAGWVGTDTFTYRAYDGVNYSANATASISVIASVGFQAEDYVSGSATGAGFTTASEGGALGGQSIVTNGNNTNASGPPVERVQYNVYFPNAGAINTYHLYVRYRLLADVFANDSGWAMLPLDSTPTSGTPWDLINDLSLHGDTTYQWVDLSASPSGINGVASYTNVNSGLHSWWFGGREAGMYADAFVFSTAVSIEGTGAGQAYLNSVVNDRPTAVADSYSVNEDGTLNVSASGVLGNDTDPESDPLTAVLVSTTSSGALTLNSNGSFSYSPSLDFNGTDSFTYRAKDLMVTSSGTATVTITVNSVNDVPSFTKGADQSVSEDAPAQTVAGWATAISPGPASESGQAVDFIVSNDNNGLFSTQPAVSPTGTLTYTPVPNASGSATVTVQIHDNGGTANGGVDTSAAQTFTITVNAVNDPPLNSVPGPQNMDVNSSLVFSSGNGNLISIADIDAAASSVLGTLTATNGTLTLNGTSGLSFSVGDGTADPTMTFSGTITAINAALAGLTFAPTSQFVGGASVQIVTNDQGATGSGGALSDTDSVAITVTNTSPTGVADSYLVNQDNIIVVAAPGVLANDTDPNVGQTLTVQAPRPLSGPSNGSLSLNADGSFSYTPSGGFVGSDSFTYMATDGINDSAVTTVTLTVSSTAYVSDSAWSSSFSGTRYLDLTFPAYVPAGSTVEGATFDHSYRSFAGGTTCYYIEVWESAALIGTHGSSGSPLSCNSGTSFLIDSVSLPEINTVARANAATIRIFVRNSSSGKSEHRLATLGVTYWLGNP